MNNFEQAIFYGRELLLTGINNGANGNISFRQKTQIYITRGGSLLSELKKSDLVKIEAANASSESPAHKLIYARLPQINAIIHIHSLAAITVSLKEHKSFIEPLDLEGKYHFKKIPIITTKLVPGARDLPEKLLNNAKSGAVIVRGHGLFVLGSSLQECYTRACTVDNICRLLLA